MTKKATIRDVAKIAGVSISSVHFALSGKPGVSEKTRVRIHAIADELGYQPNVIASSLKRNIQRIVILLPAETESNNYYYPPMWKGVRDYLSGTNLKLDCMELPYIEERKSAAIRELLRMEASAHIDGILTLGIFDDADIAGSWRDFCAHGVSVVSIGSFNKYCEDICSVQPGYEIIGRTMAELIAGHITDYGSVLMCAGNDDWDEHSLIVKGFEDYFRENSRHNKIYKDHSHYITDEHYAAILHELERPDIAACCSVFSQGSIMLGRAVEESGKAERIYAVASDLSEPTVSRLKKGIFNTVINKNPYLQGYIGIRTLAEYLTLGKKPELGCILVGSDVILKSNLIMQEDDHFRYILS